MVAYQLSITRMLLHNKDAGFERADAAAARGLRVLCTAYRQMERTEFESWKNMFDALGSSDERAVY